jgi:ribosomal protein L17
VSKLAARYGSSKKASTLKKLAIYLKSKGVTASAPARFTTPRGAGASAVRRLFKEVEERYKDTHGGHPRKIKLGRRDFDNIKLTIFELVDDPPGPEAVKSASKRGAGKKQTAKESKSRASAKQSGHKSSSKSMAAASGSALTQLRNPRSGRFVKVDTAAGTIVAHKKSSGAYKGVPVAETASTQE